MHALACRHVQDHVSPRVATGIGQHRGHEADGHSRRALIRRRSAWSVATNRPGSPGRDYAVARIGGRRVTPRRADVRQWIQRRLSPVRQSRERKKLGLDQPTPRNRRLLPDCSRITCDQSCASVPNFGCTSKTFLVAELERMAHQAQRKARRHPQRPKPIAAAQRQAAVYDVWAVCVPATAGKKTPTFTGSSQVVAEVSRRTTSSTSIEQMLNQRCRLVTLTSTTNRSSARNSVGSRRVASQRLSASRP